MGTMKARVEVRRYSFACNVQNDTVHRSLINRYTHVATGIRIFIVLACASLLSSSTVRTAYVEYVLYVQYIPLPRLRSKCWFQQLPATTYNFISGRITFLEKMR